LTGSTAVALGVWSPRRDSVPPPAAIRQRAHNWESNALADPTFLRNLTGLKAKAGGCGFRNWKSGPF
jgi:hypothetical protein